MKAVPEPTDIGPPIEQDQTWYSLTGEVEEDVRRLVALSRVVALGNGTLYRRAGGCR